MTTSDDNFTKLVALSDQAAETQKLFAPVLWEFFKSLTDQGFTREEALVFTENLQKLMLPSNNYEE